MSTGKANRWCKFFVALFCLPACVGLAITAGRTAWQLVAATTPQGPPYGLAFAAGYGLWLAIFVFLPKTTRTYVLGHELTHALWALLMGARVSGLRVGKSGGQVSTSKINWAITLAPYFFPFYALLFSLLFFVGHWLWNFEGQFWVLFFLVGLGWSFHVTFTLFTLLTARQPDVQAEGWLFSMVMIFSMNVLTMLLTTVALSGAVGLRETVHGLGRDVFTAYLWTLDKLEWLWQGLRAHAFHS